MSALKDYIGDGVYADVDDFGGFTLTTENGIDTTNTIYLEPQVRDALLKYMERIKQIRIEQNTTQG